MASTSVSTKTVVVGSQVEFERRQACDLEIGATLRAIEEIALVDVVLVDFNLGVTFRAGRHEKHS